MFKTEIHVRIRPDDKFQIELELGDHVIVALAEIYDSFEAASAACKKINKSTIAGLEELAESLANEVTVALSERLNAPREKK